QVADGGRLDSDPPPSHGYSIEARVYAEDPAKDWRPQAGTVHRFEISANVRVDSGIIDGSTVSIYYDPMLAKVVSHAST
ncbi:acetyl/propionyl-CoA carboxylase subunit alpha, partial [Mycolicibacterium elephantis]